MDLPSKNMYDTYKDCIWKELGPLDPDWFEALTAQTFMNEGNVSDQEDLFANQEESFKTPFDKPAVESQLFSTPKVFRHRLSRVVSPETEDEQSFTGEQEKETLPWTATQSPYLFGTSKERGPGAKYEGFQPHSQESFDLLHTPTKSPSSHGKCIPERLGAHIHPDISWTSSLNTPPAVPSTLILSKSDESPYPVSVSTDKNVVFVRELFPSLANASRVGVVSPKHNDIPSVHQGTVSPEAGQDPESYHSPQSPLNQSGSVWEQKLPDAIEDGEIRRTVASVLDGAENVLSMFFSNSSSALRKVKTDRIKRKQIIPTKGHGCSSADISSTNNAASSDQRAADHQEPGRLRSPPLVKTGDIGISQWSPLSLSEIPSCTVDTSPAARVENNISTELRSGLDSGQLVRPPMKLTDSGFTKKKRKFVYTVETSKLQVQAKGMPSQRMDSSPGIPDSEQEVNVKQLVKAQHEADRRSIENNEMQQQGNLVEASLPPSIQAKVQDLDMSQLCKDFAHDFSQMPDPCKPSKVVEDTPRNGFSPSACLSAMKRAKQKAMQANHHLEGDGVSNRRHVSTTNPNSSINEGTISDSGFQSAVADSTHVTASSFVLPSSEINGDQQWFQTDLHRTTSFTSTNTRNGNAHLDDIIQEAEMDAKPSSTIKESQTPGPESTSAQLPSSANGTVSSVNCIPLDGHACGSLPEKTVSLPSLHASGFKMASNKGIHISARNLERAKCLFEEPDGERSSGEPIKCAHDTKDAGHGSVNNPTIANSNQLISSNATVVDISCQLTASQKADVTELCTLLEEADSQFEFTQFKTAKLKQDNVLSPQKIVKELDPDFLSGIDFDDSFSSEAEKHLAATPGQMTLVSDSKTNFETFNATSALTGLSSAMKMENSPPEDSTSKHASKCKSHILSAEPKHLYRAGNTETSKLENKNPLMLGVGFKTAGGNILRVSKKCLSKARALFADLEENLETSRKSPDMQSSKTHVETQCKSSVDEHLGNIVQNKEDDLKLTGYGNDSGGKLQVTRIRDEDATKSLKKMDTTLSQNGFQMASGKGISISAKAMQAADAFFKDCDATDSNAGVSVKYKKSVEVMPGSVGHRGNLPKSRNVEEMKGSRSEEPLNDFEKVNAGPAVQHNVKGHGFGHKNTPVLSNQASFCGNPSLTAEALSSLSHTSKNTGSSAVNELSNCGGFCTAGGKKVSVSADAMRKAEHLLNETLEDSNKQLKHKGDTLRTVHLANQIQVSPPKNGGFQTASAKGVSVSSAALKKAKLLFDECDDIDDKIIKPTHSKMPPPRNSGLLEDTDKLKQKEGTFPPQKGGFETATGKGVVISSAALKKAKTLLNECEEVGDKIFFKPTHSKMPVPGPPHRNSGFLEDANKQLKQKDDTFPPQKGGFQTASGKEVVISSAALKKAKTLLNECDGIEDKVFVKPTHSKMPPPRTSGFLAASGKQVALSAEALQKAKALFSDISFSAEIPAVSDTRISDKKKSNAENAEKIHCGFTTAGGAKVHISQKSLLKAKNLLTEFDDISTEAMQEADAFFNDCNIMDSNDVMSVKHISGCEKKNLPKSKDQMVAKNISEERGSGGTEFENMALVVNRENLCHPNDVEIHKSVCKSTLDSTSAASSHGNPSSMTKPPCSPPSCTTSSNINSSVVNELSKRGGFCTAGGKKVSVSDDAMTKAKSLLSESAEDANKQPKQKEDNFPRHGGGFQTASGKGVAISSTALKKAKYLLNEFGEVEDKVFVKPTHSQMPPPRSNGFLAASGKQVALSAEALQKAKALFSDISFSAEIPAVSDTRISDKKKSNAENAEKIHCGFTTAGEAKVHISQKSLLKAKKLLTEFDDISTEAMQEADAFFNDCNIMDGNDVMSVKHINGCEKKNLPKSKDQMVAKNISEERGSGGTEFENMALVVNRENLCHPDDVEIHKSVCKSTLDSTSAASSHGNPSSMTKPPCSPPSCTTSSNISSSVVNELSKRGGFCTAGGKKVSVSDDAMTKAKSLLSESAEDANKQPKQKEDNFPRHGGGFQTASGKGVAISSTALKKAKYLLNECGEVEDKVFVKPTHSQMPPPRSNGFLAASGKQVAFSSEALQKAKALFSDISFSAEIPAGSNQKKQGNAENAEKIHCGFTTAGGAKVHISQKSLLKAKNLLTEFADGECHDSNSSSTSPQDAHKADRSRAKGDKDVLTEFSASLVESDHENDTRVGSPGEDMPSVLDDEINETSHSEGCKVKRSEESSVLNFKSLNLSGCTETQQKYFAQEALDCTKALLEDESLAAQSLSVTGNVPKSSFRSVEEQKGTGKRAAEDSDITGQPPLKRRLLEEFDRADDAPRSSTLHPEKSCPNGVMKDRRVFKYSVSLHPNITRPHRNGKNYVETRLQKTVTTQNSTPGENRSTHSKMPAFVPPFLKNANTECRKNTALKDNVRTSSAFVPPFKKQRTIVQESSSKPQEEEDKHNHHFNSNTFIPPTEKTQSTADVTGNKSKDDIEMVALDDNPNLPFNCGSEDSAASHVEDTLSSSQDMFQNLHNVELARDMQDMRIRKKKRQTIRPLPGSLFLTKTSGVSRIPLKAAVNEKPPARYSQKKLYGYGVHQHACEITSQTAESFRFSLQQFIKQEAFLDGGGVQLADGGWLIPSKDGTAGKAEFHRALCDTPGVDPKLISEEWVYNHYRWIVWKQASMERSFPETMGSLCLTPEQVLLQLKYRYDVEVDHSRRPALRKIMEKDDTAAKTLVLCVCGVVSRGHYPNRQSFNDTKTPQGAEAKVENLSAVVWLTDGWYTIKAQLDEPLTAMLHKGRVAVGGKLIIHGAQLVGSQDACSPLEAPESLMLKICANSSRPARWDVKLGFHKDPRPFLLPVSCLYSSGGPVGCVDIIVLRSYPIQWMERKPDGGVVFRSGRAEEKEARRYNSLKQKAMEILVAKIQAEFEQEDKGNNKPQRRRRTISRQSIASLQDGEELYEAVRDDPAYLEAHLNEQQLETLRTYRRCLMEKQQAELQERYRRALENAEDSEGCCPKRDVTPVWRLCIADSMDQPSSVYQLNLWRASSDLQSMLKEGCRYKVYNLTTSDGKKYTGSCSTVQLTGTKKTQFQDVQASQEWLSTRFQPRVSTQFVALQNPEFQSLCGEVDLTGYVVSIVDGQGFSPAFYLTDGKLNFVKVRCFSSFAQSGLEDLVKPRVLLALSNLQLRGQSMSPTPVLYAGDLTIFSTNPKEVHLQESLSQLRLLVQGQENFFPNAEETLSHLVQSDGRRFVSSPALQTSTVPSVRRQDTKPSVTSQQPIRSLGSFTPVSRKPAANCSTEKDPSSLKRRRALDYLSRIPSPPPLPHLGVVASPCVNMTFNPPRRSGTPSTLKTVQTPARKPVTSPMEDEWVNDEELAMIDTQALRVGDLL